MGSFPGLPLAGVHHFQFCDNVIFLFPCEFNGFKIKRVCDVLTSCGMLIQPYVCLIIWSVKGFCFPSIPQMGSRNFIWTSHSKNLSHSQASIWKTYSLSHVGRPLNCSLSQFLIGSSTGTRRVLLRFLFIISCCWLSLAILCKKKSIHCQGFAKSMRFSLVFE